VVAAHVLPIALYCMCEVDRTFIEYLRVAYKFDTGVRAAMGYFNQYYFTNLNRF